jgi:hypothetical protein
VAPVGGGGETAAEAADRAAAEADRAEKAADRAEKPKPAPAPAVVPAEEEPVAKPAVDPTAPVAGGACDDLAGRSTYYAGDYWTCTKGKWVRVAPVVSTPQQSCTSPKGEPGDVLVFGGAEPNRVAEHRCVKGNWVRTGPWTTPSPVDTADPVTPKD